MNIINLVDKPDIQIQNMRIIAKNFLVFDTEHVLALSFYEKKLSNAEKWRLLNSEKLQK